MADLDRRSFMVGVAATALVAPAVVKEALAPDYLATFGQNVSQLVDITLTIQTPPTPDPDWIARQIWLWAEKSNGMGYSVIGEVERVEHSEEGVVGVVRLFDGDLDSVVRQPILLSKTKEPSMGYMAPLEDPYVLTMETISVNV